MVEQKIVCIDCGHPINDSRFHFNAPGENWGAALHWFKPPSISIEELNSIITRMVIITKPGSERVCYEKIKTILTEFLEYKKRKEKEKENANRAG